MYDDENDQYGFWQNEPTGPIERIAARRRPAGPAPEAPIRRRPPVQPQIGTRQHGDTQQVPVVASAVQSVRTATQHVDPLLRRVGVLMVALALCIPVALSVRGNDTSALLLPGDNSLPVATVPATAAVELTVAPVGDGQQVAGSPSTIDIDALPVAIPVNPKVPAATTAATAGADSTQAPPSATQPAKSLEAVAPAAPACKQYEVVAGDYWILIAKKVSVSLADLLAVNGASTSTALYPGRSICVPSNASAPTTAAAPTTVKVTTTTAKVTTTTAKATTTTTAAAPAPKASYTRAEVEAIIRSVWPDHLENEALRIATRESNLQPGVRNFCCFGLFQIYFSVHKSWLAAMGVTSAEQLYDPWVNSRAAYTLYLRAGGWGPWKL